MTALGAPGIVPPPALASCVPSKERDYLKRADVVFVGRVLSLRTRDARATFRVITVRKGHLGGATVSVYPTPYPSSVTLNWSPRPGQRWRVYVQRHGQRWITNDCLGTRRV